MWCSRHLVGEAALRRGELVLGLGQAPAAAVLPTLIVCLAVMISRPQSCGRSLAVYLGRLIATLMSGVGVLA